MAKNMIVEIIGDVVQLQRDQWKGKIAYISNYPGLLDEVKKYTWTYTECEHPYLKCSKLKTSLHKFVLQFLYGKEKLDEMLVKPNIIEHLDNDGLNCTYENLHVLSDDLNKAKAFTIDKKNAALQTGEISSIPALITDVYYSHQNKYFQLQLFFNKNILFNKSTDRFVESLVFHYDDFENLYIDWLYCFECIKNEEFDYYKNHAVRAYIKDAPIITLTEEEKNAVFIERDGEYYLVIRTEPENGILCFMNHTSYRKVEENNEHAL